MVINDSLDSSFFDKSKVDSDILNGGFKEITQPRMVVIACKPKKLIVSAPLSEDVSTSISNQWSDYFSGGVLGTAFNLIESANKAMSSWNGTSIHQPYMSRKVWSGTNPLSFDLKLNFIANLDAKTEVYEPICKLAAMATASKSDLSEKEKNLIDEINIVLEDDESSGIAKALAKGVNFIKDLNDLVATKWDVPGPAMIPSENGSYQKSMPITLYIPSFSVLTDCYIENLSISMSKSVDKHGYPLGGSVNIKITRMDATTSHAGDDGVYDVDWNYTAHRDSLEKISKWVNKMYDVLGDFFGGTYEEFATLVLKVSK